VISNYLILLKHATPPTVSKFSRAPRTNVTLSLPYIPDSKVMLMHAHLDRAIHTSPVHIPPHVDTAHTS